MKLEKYFYSTEDTHTIQSYGVDVGAREIWLTPTDEITHSSHDAIPSDPGVEYSMTTRFLKNLRILVNSGDGNILIHMKTCGGDWDQGIAIYDAINHCPCRVTILNYTMARSMSSLIFCSADKRVMMPHSWFMFHDGNQGFDGTVKSFVTEADMVQRTRQQMRDIYTSCMGESAEWKSKSKASREKWLISHMDRKEEVYLSPAEAIQHGFADEIFNGDWAKLVDD